MIAGSNPETRFRQFAALNKVAELEKIYREDPSVLNASGAESRRTALHQAAARGHVDAVNWLLFHGADVFLKDKEGYNAIDLALNSDHSSVCECIYKHLQSHPVARGAIESLSHQLSSLSIQASSSSSTDIAVLSEQARVSAWQPYQWKDLEMTESSILNALSDPDLCLEKTIARIEATCFNKPARMFLADLQELMTLKVLSEYQLKRPKKITINIENLHRIVQEYFQLIKSPSEQSKIFLVRLQIDVEFEYFYKMIEELPDEIEMSPSLAIAASFWIINRSDIILDLPRKGDLIETLGELQARAYRLYCSFLKRSEKKPLFSSLMIDIVNRMHDQVFTLNERHGSLLVYEQYVASKNAKNRNNCYIEIVRGTENKRSFYHLVDKALNIKKGLQKRTQFIYFSGAAHTCMVDIDWDNKQHCFKIIAVDAALDLNPFINSLSRTLSSYKEKSTFLISQSELQKDMVSCLHYSLMLATQVSRYSYDELNQRPDLTACPTLRNTKRFPITVFGEKLILMNQSLEKMRAELTAFYKNPKKADETMRNWEEWYRFPDQEKRIDYSGYRQYSLYRKHTTPRVPTTREILDVTKTEDIGAALRKLAAGFGPGYMFSHLLTQVSPSVINEAGKGSQKTALHFAYVYNKRGRAEKLLAHGANPYLLDKEGKTPCEYKRLQ